MLMDPGIKNLLLLLFSHGTGLFISVSTIKGMNSYRKRGIFEEFAFRAEISQTRDGQTDFDDSVQQDITILLLQARYILISFLLPVDARRAGRKRRQ